ncbi:uncharacterized protein LOC108116734 [Drosophila eugracilis]|uniref:uncharacterized protein LOC108116734 n=1 Tax=Drosophila eugracilis TaxID=29029 RepID=UPI0007E833B3|nr:uncharacterized protein LOC108116734 [Drosophila eugracilis]
MRASFLISRRQPWMGQLLVMARNKALTLLLKLYRRTPIFRPRHLPTRNRTQDSGPASGDHITSYRLAEDTVLGGCGRLEVLDDLDENLLDWHSIRTQGNYELALMVGGQWEVESEEDEYGDYYDCDGCVQYVEWEGEDDREGDRIEEDLGQRRAAGAGDANATSKSLQLDSGLRVTPTKQGNFAI